jgi:dUTP pyrophosphatase
MTEERSWLRWSRLDKNLPGRLHPPKMPGDCGWDLECSESVTIRPGEAIDVPTNIAVALPKGTWGEIRARSSISRRGLQVDAGTIDNGYRGPLYALVRNMGTEECRITVGERVAQMVLHPIVDVGSKETQAIPTDTERGTGGFGSTGR